MSMPVEPLAVTAMHRLIPGLVLCAAIGAAAFVLSGWMGSAVVWALMMAMVLTSMWTPPATFAPGIAVAGKHVLRLGVALLGFQISAATLHVVDVTTLAVLAVSIVIVLMAGWLIGLALGLNRDLALIAAASVAICGASAAAAVASVLARDDRHSRDAACTIGAVSVISTLAMLAYPLLCQFLGLNPGRAGILLGGSIHEVAHAVAAGYAVDTDTGEAATVVKLMRVAMLAPAAMIIAWLGTPKSVAASGSEVPTIPAFLAGFILFAALSVSGIVPPFVETITAPISRFCLLMAMAAIGLTLPWQSVLAYGWRPIVLLLVLSALLLTIIVAYVSRLPV